MKNLNNTDEPSIHWDRASQVWRLDTEIALNVHKRDIVVHAGYGTDLASIPWMFRPIVATYGNYNRAAIVHDFLYEMTGFVDDLGQLSREECDRIFFDVMVLDGTPVWQAVTLWAAVRVWPGNYPFFRPWK